MLTWLCCLVLVACTVCQGWDLARYHRCCQRGSAMYKISAWIQLQVLKKKKKTEVRLLGSLDRQWGEIFTSGRWLIGWAGKHQELASRVCQAAGSTQTPLWIVSAIKAWKWGERTGVTLTRTSFRTQGNICFGKVPAHLPWLGDPGAALGSVVGFTFPSFSPLPPSWWGNYPDFEGDSMQRMGVLAVGVLSLVTGLAPGEIGDTLLAIF